MYVFYIRVLYNVYIIERSTLCYIITNKTCIFQEKFPDEQVTTVLYSLTENISTLLCLQIDNCIVSVIIIIPLHQSTNGFSLPWSFCLHCLFCKRSIRHACRSEH